MKKEQTINVRVPVSLWEQIRTHAEVGRRSASTELAMVIEEALAVRKAAAKPVRKAQKTPS